MNDMNRIIHFRMERRHACPTSVGTSATIYFTFFPIMHSECVGKQVDGESFSEKTTSVNEKMAKTPLEL